jgi:LmbE family N-acetylglucosaminyl deacetylase
LNILVIAAHPDDETLGCGGTLLKHIAAGDKVSWIIATGPYRPKWSSEIIAEKSAEIEQVAAAYPMEDCFRLGFPAAGLETVPFPEIMQEIVSIAESVQPEMVYVVHGGDVHGDHRTLFSAAASVFKPFYLSRYGTKRFLCFETLSSTDSSPSNAAMPFVPNVFSLITPYLERKLEILSLYRSEIQPDPLPRGLSAVRAQARLRGATIGVEYAEALCSVWDVI